MKVLTKVIKVLIRIKREFLWGGSIEIKKTYWVKWNVVCKPKRSSGLGIKDVHLFNLSLLGKWLWRIVNNENVLWFEVLKFIYRSSNLGSGFDYSPRSVAESSVWWRELYTIE